MITKKQYKVLLVDDNPQDLSKTQIQLERSGYEVVTADSQKKAENILAEFRPDIAVFNLMMENDDSGFILSYRCKSKYPEVPIIIATNVIAETGIKFRQQEQSTWIKAELFLEKGIQTEQLHESVTKLLNKTYGN